jgi:hypothetical protein
VLCFVSADSKRVTDDLFVSADSKGDSLEDGWPVGMLEELKVPEEPAAVVFQRSGECERRLGRINDDHAGV